jgi:RNA polymerase primary sigma factor
MRPEHKLMCAIFGEPVEERDDLYYEERGGVSLREALTEALDSICEYGGPAFRQRYKRVILLRFGFESPDGRGRTLEQVGVEYGVTRERIREIEAKTLRLLRHPRRSSKLKEYLKGGSHVEKV